MEVTSRAVGTMLGFIMMASWSRGPRPSPVRKPNPSNIPILVERFFPLSGVKNRPNARPAARREQRMPPPLRRSVNRWT